MTLPSGVVGEFVNGGAIDITEQGSPGWWANYLWQKFTQRDLTYYFEGNLLRQIPIRTRRDRMNMLWAYFIGQPPLPQVAEGYTVTFQDILRKGRATYAPMAINPVVDRMEVTGIGSTATVDVDAASSPAGLAKQIFDGSNFPAAVKDAITYALVMGEGYLMAVPAAEGSPDKIPLITAEDPRLCIGEPDTMNPNQLRAALKIGYDPVAGREIMWLFVGGQRFSASRMSVPNPSPAGPGFGGFKWDGPPTDMPEIAGFGGVPVVRLVNVRGLGEFEPHLDLLDRINDTILQRIVITWYQSFRQRAIKGDLQGDEAQDGAPEPDFTDVFKADPGALWHVPDGVDFWESSQADMTPIITSIRDDVKEFAAVLGIPLYLITPDAANQSAEGAVSQREALRFKVRDRRARSLPLLRQVLAMAFAFAGSPQSASTIDIQWGTIEGRSLAEMAAAVAQTTNVLSKRRQMIDIMDMTPEEAALNIQELLQDLLLFQAALPAPPVATTPVDASGNSFAPNTSAADQTANLHAMSTAGN
ncbi:phage portal protein [Nocardia panacis]|uniref:phage portal protein n=1 Tax=Nocardia panacis TaxID=2340916 RepID=UPI0011C403D6|nr:phage portal protein [Nocardia panacis]